MASPHVATAGDVVVVVLLCVAVLSVRATIIKAFLILIHLLVLIRSDPESAPKWKSIYRSRSISCRHGNVDAGQVDLLLLAPVVLALVAEAVQL